MSQQVVQQKSTAKNFLDLYLINDQKAVTTALKTLASIFIGILLLGILARMAIPLPFTPVPITGQTFGVILVALLFGRNKGFFTVCGYLALGTLGFPLFAIAGGITSGYLVGMAIASIVVGHFADLGWSSSFVKSIIAGTLGTAIIFICGLGVLAAFIPFEKIWMAGLIPFLPGAVIKILLAAAVASGLHTHQKAA